MQQSERWQEEREFFDAEEYPEGPLEASTIERYTLCRKPYLPAEYPFWRLGDVRGKRILEVGCGAGGNAIILALKGASVVGVDISPRAIAIARQRAALHGVEDRASFHALPLEAYLEQDQQPFDIICAFAFLHHVIPVLDDVLASLHKLAHERTLFLFVEPVALSATLRRLRLALPIKTHGTPDERPLEPAEIGILRRSLPGLRIQYFTVFLRPWHRFVGGRYEDYSPFQRTFYDTLARLDRALLAIPGAQALACWSTIYSGPSVG